MKLWIARDNAIIPDDMEHFIERHPEKEIIEEGIQVYKSEYDEDYTCGNCEWFNKGECLETGEQVYADDPSCKEYRD